MRALTSTLLFLLTTLGFAGVARANPPLWAPRMPLMLALDWNQIAVSALSRPKAPVTRRATRHQIPKLTLTASAALAAPQLDLAAYGRAEGWLRAVASPRYTAPEAARSPLFRQLYLSPYAPYLGAFGATVTVETDALLR